jgi:Mitochondrial ribosomal protein (VAR1)
MKKNNNMNANAPQKKSFNEFKVKNSIILFEKVKSGRKTFKQLNWDKKNNCKKILIINDNKFLSKAFRDNYSQFLSRIKGTLINSKDDIIKVLNRKPTSFLTRLNNVIKRLNIFKLALIKNFSLIRLQTQTQTQTQTKTKTKTIGSVNKKSLNSSLDLNKNLYTAPKLPDLKSEILTKKINILQNLLENNELPIPLNLLKPFLKFYSINSLKKNSILPLSIKGEFIIRPSINECLPHYEPVLKKGTVPALTQPSLAIDPKIVKVNNKNSVHNASITKGPVKGSAFSLTQTPSPRVAATLLRSVRVGESVGPVGLDKQELKPELKHLYYDQIAKLNILEYFKNKVFKFNYNNSIWINYVSKGYQTSYTPIIERYMEILKNYNNNNRTNITVTKYFQLLTPYKKVLPFSQFINYNFNKFNNKNIQNIQNLLEYAFRSMSCLISKPVFMETPDNLIINLFYYFVPGKVKKYLKKNKRSFYANSAPLLRRERQNWRVTSLNGISIKNGYATKFVKSNKKISKFKKFLNHENIKKLNILCNILSKIFNKPVEFDLIPLRLPFFDDNILVKAIGIMSKRIPVRTIFNFIYRNTKLYSKRTADYRYRYSITRSFISGIKIKIGGRLMTQKVIPKRSSRTIQRGAIAQGKVCFVDWSRVNLKNRRGAHSITVTMGHVI